VGPAFVGGWRQRRGLQMFEKSYSRKWGRRGWVPFFTIVVLIGVAATAMGQINESKDDITGTVSKAEPPTAQNGTPAHPYGDASQCPLSTDLVFWPRSDRSIPSIPPGISVCIVGDQSFNNTGPDPEVRIR
jgi:hypothetical protein